MNTEIEVLYRAEASLAGDEEFTFRKWMHCTCGHIYLGATGRMAQSSLPITCSPADTPYGRTILAAARALGWNKSYEGNCGAGDMYNAAGFLSDLTIKYKQGRGNPSREDALKVVRGAIAVLEQQGEQARLAVLSQTAEVVDAVDMDELEADLRLLRSGVTA